MRVLSLLQQRLPQYDIQESGGVRIEGRFHHQEDGVRPEHEGVGEGGAEFGGYPLEEALGLVVF